MHHKTPDAQYIQSNALYSYSFVINPFLYAWYSFFTLGLDIPGIAGLPHYATLKVTEVLSNQMGFTCASSTRGAQRGNLHMILQKFMCTDPDSRIVGPFKIRGKKKAKPQRQSCGGVHLTYYSL